MSFINVHDEATDATIAAAATQNFDVPVTVESSGGGTANLGTRVKLHVRTDKHLEVRILYSVDGGTTFRDRGTVDQIAPESNLDVELLAIGTNMRIALKNVAAAEATVTVYTMLY